MCIHVPVNTRVQLCIYTPMYVRLPLRRDDYIESRFHNWAHYIHEIGKFGGHKGTEPAVGVKLEAHYTHSYLVCGEHVQECKSRL
jgi:hypothetical protein